MLVGFWSLHGPFFFWGGVGEGLEEASGFSLGYFLGSFCLFWSLGLVFGSFAVKAS